VRTEFVRTTIHHSPFTTNYSLELPMTKLKYLLTSRKFWAAFVGLLLLTLKAWYPDFPLAEDQLTDFIYLLIAYITGTALEDGLTNINTKQIK
jgi:hypothetical protein